MRIRQKAAKKAKPSETGHSWEPKIVSAAPFVPWFRFCESTFALAFEESSSKKRFPDDFSSADCLFGFGSDNEEGKACLSGAKVRSGREMTCCDGRQVDRSCRSLRIPWILGPKSTGERVDRSAGNKKGREKKV